MCSHVSLLQHLREEFPGPKSDSGPQLSEENSSGQIGLDLCQQLGGLLVQAVRVRQQAVVDDLLLRFEPSHVSILGHIPVKHESCFVQRRQTGGGEDALRVSESCGKCAPVLADIIRCIQRDRKEQICKRKYVTLIELQEPGVRRPAEH